LGNSPNFLTITHTTLPARRFRSCGILTIDVTAEFCTWTEWWHNGSSISTLGLAETPEVQNTVLEDNSLCSPMVHLNAPNGYRFACYGSQNLDQLLNQYFWQIIPSCIKQVFGKISA
jgi:hypothetical protein